MSRRCGSQEVSSEYSAAASRFITSMRAVTPSSKNSIVCW